MLKTEVSDTVGSGTEQFQLSNLEQKQFAEN